MENKRAPGQNAPTSGPPPSRFAPSGMAPSMMGPPVFNPLMSPTYQWPSVYPPQQLQSDHEGKPADISFRTLSDSTDRFEDRLDVTRNSHFGIFSPLSSAIDTTGSNRTDDSGKAGSPAPVPQTHITISEDRSADSQFSRQLLSALISKNVNSGKRDNQEWESEGRYENPDPTNLQLTWSSTISSQDRGETVPGRALEDYQMQMMLLEQQNKKRLVMARQKQDSMTTSPKGSIERDLKISQASRTPYQLLPKFTDLGAPVSSRENRGSSPSSFGLASRKSTTADEKTKDSLTAPGPCSRSLTPTSETGQDTSANGIEEKHDRAETTAAEEPTERPLRQDPNINDGDGVSTADIERLRAYVMELELSNKYYRMSQDQRPARPPRWQILYRISNQTSSIFFDHPSWDANSGEGKFLKSNKPLSNLPLYLEKNKEIAFIVYKDFVERTDDDGNLEDSTDPNFIAMPTPSAESIQVVSPSLIIAVETLFRVSPEVAESLGSSQLDAPYLFFYRSRDILPAVVGTMPMQSQKEFTLLSQYVYKHHGEEYAMVDQLLERGRISAPYIRYLFKPNDVLVRKNPLSAFVATSLPRFEGLNNTKQEYSAELEKILEKLTIELKEKEGGCPKLEPRKSEFWSIGAWSWVFDGAFRKSDTFLTFEIPVFDQAEISINQLNVCPLRFAKEDVKCLLRKRGQTFWRCRFRRFVSYVGDDVNDPQTTEGERYMIDMSAYKKLHSHMSTSNDQLGAAEMAKDEPPDGDFIFLLPPTIKGYNLRRKKWLDLQADLISDVKWNKQAFKSLVVDDETKELIQALVTNQLAAERSTDLISGKGNGLIILLHGGPGTGKTLTAESVAEIAEKPLYRVTCGDIGTQPEAVEKYLESVLHLGKLWECVVLLDEADVFLEERTLSDLQRNALVSVFLRVLEYYEGIMILTSNRVGTFDEAFKSRIQLALHYENLTSSQRRKIWRNFVTRLKALEEPNINYDDIFDHMDDLAKEEMNGRQIRNAITTARQLAQYKGEELRYTHIKHVIGVAGKFDMYLKKVNEGLNDDQIARDGGLR